LLLNKVAVIDKIFEFVVNVALLNIKFILQTKKLNGGNCMKKLISLLLVLVLVTVTLLFAGCSSKQTEEPAASKEVEEPAANKEVEEPKINEESNEDFQRFKGQELNLYVAAGMKIPMDEVIEAFQKKAEPR